MPDCYTTFTFPILFTLSCTEFCIHLHLAEIVNYHKRLPINEGEMGGTSGMYGKEQKCIQGSGGET
jgi:hypothetical protein